MNSAVGRWFKAGALMFIATLIVAGCEGAAGVVGSQGETGPAGADGATGPQGETGPLGPAGPQGETGPDGADGADGATGPQGEIGPAGADGADGATGPQGEIGPLGPAGPQGPPGEAPGEEYFAPFTTGMIKPLVFNNMDDGMASMETKPVDLTMYMRGHGLTYELKPSSTMVTATVDDAGMLSVSIDKMSTYSDYKVDITATDSRGTKITDDVVVRRNRKPVAGGMKMLDLDSEVNDAQNEIWVGTQEGKNTYDITLVIKGNGCKADCHFGDDDQDSLMFEVASGNMRQVTGAHKSKNMVTITGLKSSSADMGTIFTAVPVAVRAKDSGKLRSNYQESFVTVNVNQAPKPKDGKHLPALALPFGGESKAVLPDAMVKDYFDDPDGPLDEATPVAASDTAAATAYVVSWKSSDLKVAAPMVDGVEGAIISAVGPGTATITVTLREPMDSSSMNLGMGQTATQTFMVTVRDK